MLSNELKDRVVAALTPIFSEVDNVLPSFVMVVAKDPSGIKLGYARDLDEALFVAQEIYFERQVEQDIAELEARHKNRVSHQQEVFKRMMNQRREDKARKAKSVGRSQAEQINE